MINTTREFLNKNTDIMFTYADKGNSTVCIKKSDYKAKMLDLLHDRDTYIELDSNPLEKLQNDTADILHDLNNNDFLNYKYHYNDLTQTDTMLAKAYGLVKIHKPNAPLRPVISLTNTPTYKLAKFLYQDLKKAIPLPKSHINNSFEFVNKIEGTCIHDDDVLLSLDVVSLFTNITCEQVIRSLERRAHIIRRKCKIPFNDIIEHTKFLFANTVFSFNGQFFKQIKGTPMGSPISNLFANIVMEDLETECLTLLKNNHNCIPKKYFRYVDDTFLIVDKNSINLIVNVFNSYDMNLKFTHEIENDKKISFLDVMVINDNNKIITDWYQKSVYSGRIIHFLSSHPTYQKKNIIYNLVDRAFLLSDKIFHSKNREIIIDILIRNKYPLDFINQQINKRFNKIIYIKKDVHINDNSNSQSNKILCIPNISNLLKLNNFFKPYNICIILFQFQTLQNVIKR